MRTTAERAADVGRKLTALALAPPDSPMEMVKHLIEMQKLSDKQTALAIIRDVELAAGPMSDETVAVVRTIAEMIEGDPNERSSDRGGSSGAEGNKGAQASDAKAGRKPD